MPLSKREEWIFIVIIALIVVTVLSWIDSSHPFQHKYQPGDVDDAFTDPNTGE